eukprot:10007007-Alexandrium_andersonii.AAC.1
MGGAPKMALRLRSVAAICDCDRGYAKLWSPGAARDGSRWLARYKLVCYGSPEYGIGGLRAAAHI